MAQITRTLAQLRSEARSRCDQTGSSFRDDAYFNQLINEGIEWLRDECLDTPGALDIFLKRATLTGSSPIALPSDLYHLVGLYDANRRLVDRYQQDQLSFATEAVGTLTFTIDYLTGFTRLSADSDSFAFWPGWDDAVVCWVAAKVLTEEESNHTVLEQAAMRALDRVRRLAQHRDRLQQSRVQDRRSYRNDRYIDRGTTYMYRLEGTSIRFFVRARSW